MCDCVAPPEEPQIDLAVGSWVSDHNSYKMAVKVYAGPVSWVSFHNLAVNH